MIYVTFDTSAISKMGTHKADYEAIKRLVDSENIEIHIPYVVKRELETQRILLNKESLNNITKQINNLKKTLMGASNISDFMNYFEKSKKEIMQDVEDNVKDFFEGWKAIIHQLDETQSINALEAYFEGKLPLSEPKNREDIPDSFICRSIENLKDVNNIDSLVVVANDKKVIRNFEGKEGFSIYKTIEEFIRAEDIQLMLSNLDIIESIRNNPQDLVVNFEQDSSAIKSYLSDAVGEAIYNKSIIHYSIPDDNNEAIINGYDEGHDIKLNFDNIIHYGNNQIGVKFELNIWVNAYFFIYKRDYYIEEYNFSVSDWNDYYFESEDEFHVKVNGVVSIKPNHSNLDITEIDLLDNDEINDHLHDYYCDSIMNIESIDSIELI